MVATHSRPVRDRDEVDFTWLVQRCRQAGGWAGRHRVSRDRIVLVGGGLVAVILAAWLTSGAWGGRPISGDDSMAHVVRAQFAFRNLITHGRVDGWDPSFIVGYQEFLFIGAGFSWTVGLLHAVSLGALSITGAVKVVTLVSFVIAPLAVAFVAKSFGLSGRGAGVAAVLSLAVNNPFGGVGLQGVFNVGLLPHQFAAVFFFLSLGGTVRILRGGRGRWVVLTALSAAALLLSHGISVIIFAAMVGVVLITSSAVVPSVQMCRDRWAAMIGRAVAKELHRMGIGVENSGEAPVTPLGDPTDRTTASALVRLSASLAAAGAIAACALLPFWGHRNLRGIFTAWGTPPLSARLAEIWRGQILYQPGVTRFVVLGMAYGFVRVAQGKRYALPLVATPLVYLVGSHVAFYLWPGSVVTPQLTNRGLGYAGVLAVLPLAALVAALTKKLGTIGDGLAIALAAGIVLVPVSQYRQLAKQTAEPIPELREAAKQLHRLVPDAARFVTERDFPGEIARTKVVDPDRWLAWASGRYTLNNFNVESSQSPGPAYEGEHILDRPPEVIADSISRLGVTHLVTVSDGGADHVAASSRFILEWRASSIAIYAVVPASGQPGPGTLITAASAIEAGLLKAGPEHLSIDVDSATATPAAVAVGWSPKWHASLDGRPLVLRKSPDGVLALQLPAGRHRLRLDFRRDVWDFAGIVTTLSAMVAGGIWLGRSWRRQRAAVSST